jgi:hypothetical protein
VPSGRILPIRLEITNFSNVDLSSAAIAVTAVCIAPGAYSSPLLTPPQPCSPVPSAGSTNPNGAFRFDSTLGASGGYIFNLNTKGLKAGTYTLFFTILGDPLYHLLVFVVG